MVVFDANYLMHLLQPNAGDPIDPATGRPVEQTRGKIENLIQTLTKAKEKIIIPTPVLSEVFSLDVEAAHRYLSVMQNTYRMELASFDAVAAIEAGIANAEAHKKGDKRGGASSTWQKVKIDRQIVAIAKTRGAATIYSNDDDVRTLADKDNIKVISVWELPDPPPQQTHLEFDPGEVLAENSPEQQEC